eukprot:1409077-Pyramimonas_sp.AAC.1
MSILGMELDNWVVVRGSLESAHSSRVRMCEAQRFEPGDWRSRRCLGKESVQGLQNAPLWHNLVEVVRVHPLMNTAKFARKHEYGNERKLRHTCGSECTIL